MLAGYFSLDILMIPCCTSYFSKRLRANLFSREQFVNLFLRFQSLLNQCIRMMWNYDCWLPEPCAWTPFVKGVGCYYLDPLFWSFILAFCQHLPTCLGMICKLPNCLHVLHRTYFLASGKTLLPVEVAGLTSCKIWWIPHGYWWQTQLGWERKNKLLSCQASHIRESRMPPPVHEYPLLQLLFFASCRIKTSFCFEFKFVL